MQKRLPSCESIWHYWQRMELPFTIYLPGFALRRWHIREGVKTEPIITQGNQTNWHADQWPPWLMPLLSRWTAPQRDPRSAATETGRGAQQRRESRSPPGQHGDVPRQVQTGEDGTSRSGPHQEQWRCFWGFTTCYTPSVWCYSALYSGTCGSLVESHGRWDEYPNHFLKDPLKAFREMQLTVIPPQAAAASCLSLWAAGRFVETWHWTQPGDVWMADDNAGHLLKCSQEVTWKCSHASRVAMWAKCWRHDTQKKPLEIKQSSHFQSFMSSCKNCNFSILNKTHI